MEFTFHTPRRNLAVGRDTLNALTVDGDERVLIVGNELSDEDFDTLAMQFGTDEGTTVIREDAPASAVRSSVVATAGKIKRKVSFSRVTANTPEAPTVAYVVRLKQI